MTKVIFFTNDIFSFADPDFEKLDQNISLIYYKQRKIIVLFNTSSNLFYSNKKKKIREMIVAPNRWIPKIF